jgi:hypothetical protein
MIGTTLLIYNSCEESTLLISAETRVYFSIAEAETAEMVGMGGMGNKVAKATMERPQHDGPTVAYVLSFNNANRTGSY